MTTHINNTTTPTNTGASYSRRFTSIDVTRGIAIILAMVAHSLSQFEGDIYLHKILTRTATPTFLFLFGIILEVVYLKKARHAEQLPEVQARLLSRGITCYALFACITVSGFIGGKLSEEQTINALILLEGGRFGVILVLYSVLMVLSALALPMIIRHGLPVVFYAAGAAWILKFTLSYLELTPVYFFDFFLGYGGSFGPSIFPSIFLIVFGMLFGQLLTNRVSIRSIFVFFSIPVVITTYLLFDYGVREFLENYAFMAFRINNHPAYFTFGLLAACGWYALARGTENIPEAAYLRRGIERIGRQSLFVYAFGNSALNMLPYYTGNAWVGISYAGVFMMLLLLIALDLGNQNSYVDRVFKGLFKQARRTWNTICMSITRRMFAIKAKSVR